MPPVWTETPIHFLDFEGNQRSGILEYGVVTVLRGQVISAHTRLCAARDRIRAEETAVHGLSDEDLRDQRPLSDDWDLFASLRESGPFAAHFSGVENSLIKTVWPYPRSCPDFGRPGEQAADWGPWVDTAPLCLEFFPGQSSSNLETLIQTFGLQPQLDALSLTHCPEARRMYHAALYDALAGALLLCHIARMAPDPSLARLILLSTRNPDRRDTLSQGTLF